MKLEVTLTNESIENAIEYIKTHPKEIKGLMQYLGEELLDILMTRRVLKKGADLYRAINGEINYSYTKDEREC